MHRPFMRVAVVLALLVCALTAHGRHSEDSRHPGVAAEAGVAAVDDSHAPAAPTFSAAPGADRDEQHDDTHGDTCGSASSMNRPAATQAPPSTAAAEVVTSAADSSATGRAPIPVAQHGRSLLLLGCVSRT